MATYQYLLSTGSNGSTSYAWGGIWENQVTIHNSSFFIIPDSDGTVTEIDGTGFTYDALGFPTGGTITAAFHHSTSSDTSPLVEQLTNITGVDISLFATNLENSPADAFDELFGGNDTIVTSNITNTMYYDGLAGTNTLDLSGGYSANGALVTFGIVAAEEGLVQAFSGPSHASQFNNIQVFAGSSNDDTFKFVPNGNGVIPSGLTIGGGGGGNDTILITNTSNNEAFASLSGYDLISIGHLEFDDTGVTAGTISEVDFDATQFGGGGLSNTLAVQGDANTKNFIDIHMFAGGSSFNASGFSFTAAAQDTLNVDGSSTPSNITIVGANVSGSLFGGAGNDAFTAFAPESVNGGAGFNTLVEGSAAVTAQLGSASMTKIQEFVANSGTNTISVKAGDTDFVYLYGGTGNDTMSTGSGGGYMFDNNGGTNSLTGGSGPAVFVGGGTSHNTMNGGSGNNTYYTTGNDTIHGGGTFNTDILLVGGVTLAMGSSAVQEVVLNSGTNSLSMTGSSQFVYLYGGAGNDTLTTGSGGGYMFGEGGVNVLTGGGGTNIFVGGSAGSNTMNGGSAVNYYYATASDTIHGAGTFNAIVETDTGVTETLGASSRQDIQEVIANSGANTLDASALSTQIYLYGGSGNDTLFGGKGNDYLYGGLGTNTFKFAASWGADTIMDWTAGTNSIVDLTALSGLGVHAITDLTQTITGGNDVITSSHTGANSITLMGVGSALAGSSFHFA